MDQTPKSFFGFCETPAQFEGGIGGATKLPPLAQSRNSHNLESRSQNLLHPLTSLPNSPRRDKSNINEAFSRPALSLPASDHDQRAYLQPTTTSAGSDSGAPRSSQIPKDVANLHRVSSMGGHGDSLQKSSSNDIFEHESKDFEAQTQGKGVNN